jgi:hypothetical protein
MKRLLFRGPPHRLTNKRFRGAEPPPKPCRTEPRLRPYEIVIQPAPREKRFRGDVGGWSTLLGGQKGNEAQGAGSEARPARGECSGLPRTVRARRTPPWPETTAGRPCGGDVEKGGGRKQLGHSWRPPWESGHGADHDQQAPAAMWTGLARPEGETPEVVRAGGRCRGIGGQVGGCTRKPELDVRPESPMGRTPEPIGPDLVDALRPYVWPEAADERLRRQGHGFPTRGPGVLIAKAHLAIVDDEEQVVRQGDTVDIPAQVAKHGCRALYGRCAIDDPVSGPDRRGDGQIRAFLAPQGAEAAAEQLRARPDEHNVRRTGGLPLVPVGGDPTGRDQAVDVRMVDEGPGTATGGAARSASTPATAPGPVGPAARSGLPPLTPRTRTSIRCRSMAETCRWVPSGRRSPQA